jgi:GWxTD domain-containing protein
MRGANKKFVLSFIIIFSIGCSSCLTLQKDPFYEVFLEKARLIMTEEELEICRLLPDKKSKEEFIKDFWRIRDPFPETEESEGRIEFERRIAYANKWFDPYQPGSEFNSGQGWNTDRGRMYLVFGHPDKVIFGGFSNEWTGQRNRSTDDRFKFECWYYYIYGICLWYEKKPDDKWRLMSIDQRELEAMDSAKLNLVVPELREFAERKLRFEGRYENNALIITIPKKTVLFDEREDKLHSQFKAVIKVYRNHKKMDEIEVTRSLIFGEDEVWSMKNISFEIPYELPIQGNYLFDITIEDLMALSFSGYRILLNYKAKKDPENY